MTGQSEPGPGNPRGGTWAAARVSGADPGPAGQFREGVSSPGRVATNGVGRYGPNWRPLTAPSGGQDDERPDDRPDRAAGQAQPGIPSKDAILAEVRKLPAVFHWTLILRVTKDAPDDAIANEVGLDIVEVRRRVAQGEALLRRTFGARFRLSPGSQSRPVTTEISVLPAPLPAPAEVTAPVQPPAPLEVLRLVAQTTEPVQPTLPPGRVPSAAGPRVPAPSPVEPSPPPAEERQDVLSTAALDLPAEPAQSVPVAPPPEEPLPSDAEETGVPHQVPVAQPAEPGPETFTPPTEAVSPAGPGAPGTQRVVPSAVSDGQAVAGPAPASDASQSLQELAAQAAGRLTGQLGPGDADSDSAARMTVRQALQDAAEAFRQAAERLGGDVPAPPAAALPQGPRQPPTTELPPLPAPAPATGPVFQVGADAFFGARHFVHVQGKQGAPHHHSYRVEAVMESPKQDRDGIVMGFTEARGLVEGAVADYNETLLNTVPPFTELPPTCENLARVIFERIAGQLTRRPVRLKKVRVWESPTSHASYSDDTVAA